MNTSHIDDFSNSTTTTDYNEFVKYIWTWTSFVQLIMALVGITGNGIVIVVYRNRQATSATNELLVALAVADLLTSILIIPVPSFVEVPLDWRGELYCKVVISAVFMWTSITVSVFILTVVSVERYLAISYPSKYPIVFSNRSRSKIILIIWTAGTLLNTYSFFIWTNANGTCVIIWPRPWFPSVVGITLFIFKYFLPVMIMAVTQAATTKTLYFQKRDLLDRNVPKTSPALSSLEVKSKVVGMLRVVVFMFIVCWTADQFGHLGFTIGFVPLRYLMSTTYRCFVQLAFLNSVINPIIYAFTNSNFRKALLKLFLCNRLEDVQPKSSGVNKTSLAINPASNSKITQRYPGGNESEYNVCENVLAKI